MLSASQRAALAGVQACVQRVYGLEGPLPEVGDYVLTDGEVSERLAPDVTGGRIEERLLVAEDDEGVALSLYLAPGLLERCLDSPPPCRPEDGRFADWLVVLEGVSHFLYVAWRAERARATTLLELELQAEVDKYVVGRLFLCPDAVDHRLHPRLFAGADWVEGLPPEALARYRLANHWAARYCAALERRWRGPGRGRRVLADLRRFWRLSGRAKLGHIAALH